VADTRTLSNSSNTAPCQDAEVAVKNDGVTPLITGVGGRLYCYRALYVGGAGDIKLVTINGNTITFTAVPAGTILPVGCTQIFSTGTTATNLVGMW